MADDAGGPRNEEHGCGRFFQKARTREHRARPVFRRVLIGADLARIFDGDRRGLACEKVDHHRAARCRAEGARCGDVPGHVPAAGDQRVAARLVELPIPLRAKRVDVDLGKIIPDSQQMAVADGIEDGEDLAISLFSRCVQRRSMHIPDERGGGDLRDRYASEEHVVVASITNTGALSRFDRLRSAPDLANTGACPQHRGVDLGHGNVRPVQARGRVIESDDTQHFLPPRRLVFGQRQIVDLEAGFGTHQPVVSRSVSAGLMLIARCFNAAMDVLGVRKEVM